MNVENSPSVAVIIAAYNSAGTIARAVKSALAEREAAEVIVADDASTDGTADAARAAGDGSGRLKILMQPRNLGPSAARNRAIAESSAPWIGALDADDFFVAGRLSRLLGFSDRADLIADDIGQAREDAPGGPRKSLLAPYFDKEQTCSSPPGSLGENPSPDPSRKGRGTQIEKFRQITFAEFVSSNVTRRKKPRGELGFIKPLMRRAFLETHNLRYREDMRLGEDYEIYARALALGARLRLIPDQGYVSVMRAHSLSGRHSEDDLLRLRDCDLDLRKIPGLSGGDKAALRAHYSSVDCRLQWRLLINAVKARDAHAVFAAFLRPAPVPFYLLGQLAQQVVGRTGKKIKLICGKDGASSPLEGEDRKF